FGEDLLHRRDWLRRADPGDDVLALRVGEELAPRARLARRRVAGEGHPGAGVLPLVSEDHLDDVDRGAEVVRDAARAPVDLRPRRVPRIEDRADRGGELVARVLGEVLSRLLLVHALEGLDEL